MQSVWPEHASLCDGVVLYTQITTSVIYYFLPGSAGARMQGWDKFWEVCNAQKWVDVVLLCQFRRAVYSRSY